MFERVTHNPGREITCWEPWTTDHVRCLGCGYEWIAVRTLQTDHERLECPECLEFTTELATDGRPWPRH